MVLLLAVHTCKRQLTGQLPAVRPSQSGWWTNKIFTESGARARAVAAWELELTDRTLFAEGNTRQARDTDAAVSMICECTAKAGAEASEWRT